MMTENFTLWIPDLDALKPEHGSEVFGAVRERAVDGGALITVSGKPETRTAQQNKYLWGVVYRTIVEFMREHKGRDYSDEAVHETLKALYLPSRVESLASGDVTIYKSTTKLTRKEFAEYVEHIMRWAAEFGCVIPEPEWRWHLNTPEAQAA